MAKKTISSESRGADAWQGDPYFLEKMISIIMKSKSQNAKKCIEIDVCEITKKIKLAAHTYHKHERLIKNTPRISYIRKSMDALYAASTSLSACIASLDPPAVNLLDKKIQGIIDKTGVPNVELEILKLFMYDGTKKSHNHKIALENALKRLANFASSISNELELAYKDDDCNRVEKNFGKARMNLVVDCYSIFESCDMVVEYSYCGNLSEFVENMFSYVGVGDCDLVHYIKILKESQKEEDASATAFDAGLSKFDSIKMRDLLAGLIPPESFHEGSQSLTDEDVQELANAAMNLTRARHGAVSLEKRKGPKKRA